jgi:hypothetical protein
MIVMEKNYEDVLQSYSGKMVKKDENPESLHTLYTTY